MHTLQAAKHCPCSSTNHSTLPISATTDSSILLSQVYALDRWEVTHTDNSTETYSGTALDNLKVRKR